jgi:predicted ATP-grasp superfamily ATP-dependent carboligase
LPEHRILLRAFDKDETTRQAASLGIAVPATSLLTDVDQARAASLSAPYPVVLKPRASEEARCGVVRAAGRPRYARNQAEFELAYGEISRRSSAVLMQPYVAGEGAGYFALMRHGELRAEFAHRRIRDMYPTGSAVRCA